MTRKDQNAGNEPVFPLGSSSSLWFNFVPGMVRIPAPLSDRGPAPKAGLESAGKSAAWQIRKGQLTGG